MYLVEREKNLKICQNFPNISLELPAAMYSIYKLFLTLSLLVLLFHLMGIGVMSFEIHGPFRKYIERVSDLQRRLISASNAYTVFKGLISKLSKHYKSVSMLK